jgi:hypothetical protein
MLAQLVCVDRRYQRMNCFNIREIQSILKRRFFNDLINTSDHHEFLNQTMLGLRYKTNNLNALNPNMFLFHNYGLDLSFKNRSVFFSSSCADFSENSVLLSNKSFLFSCVNFIQTFSFFSFFSVPFVETFVFFYATAAHALSHKNLIGIFVQVLVYFTDLLVSI